MIISRKWCPTLRAQPAIPLFRLLLIGLFFGPVLQFLVGCSGSSSEPTGPTGSTDPASLTVVEGEGAQAPAGTVLPVGPTVEVRDSEGRPVAGSSVTFLVLEGGGAILESTVPTNSMGRAHSVWLLGRTVGEAQKVRATLGSLQAEITAEAITAVPGRAYLGRLGYTEYRPGTLPLVITAPHGGTLKPTEIPDRTWGTTVRDTNTDALALAIREAIFVRTGAYPHVILSHLHRSKLDPNREIDEAAQDNTHAERAWWEFQYAADEAGELVEGGFGEGLHLDIHGHGHDIDRLELGYLLSSSTLELNDEFLSGATYVNQSSVKAIVEKGEVTLAELVRGPFSLGTLMESRFVPAVPSTNQPDPAGGSFFSGGYNTVRHGSRNGGNISGIQIEHHYPGIRDTAENRQTYAEALADALLVYFPAHFGFELTPVS